uniref:Putative secreted protein n=1 Tax=Anopheles darlingi TaxID=43151 RepID=A0A2M4DKK4_ANODA
MRSVLLFGMADSCSSSASFALATLSRSSFKRENFVSKMCSCCRASSGRVRPPVGLFFSQSFKKSTVRASTALSSDTILACRLATCV